MDADLELFLTGFIRSELALIGTPVTQGVFVSNAFPADARPKLVVVMDNGGPSTSIITSQPSVGITVMAGDDPSQGAEAKELARLVKMIVKDSARADPGNPVAAVLNSSGPFRITEEGGQPSYYLTFELAVVGQPFE
ncbi:hypothetical protein [Arthrobacter sp. SDTb3-6]|uniref:hypothetical protein n=1 Tax=Arthrobacter sp. SDTb3-6 TaxID=2713571 RepID=UPI00159E71D3|nr:hypothetical protein [Arthrobacter sp. SDTb3-6]NVM97827.1 hypothetical protein [Arthrobacter sp. SDTb3-6]